MAITTARQSCAMLVLTIGALFLAACGTEASSTSPTSAVVESSSTTAPAATPDEPATAQQASRGSYGDAVYEVVNVESAEVLSRHRTRQAALDSWRVDHAGKRVEIWRREVPAGDVLIVEGVWHESTRPG